MKALYRLASRARRTDSTPTEQWERELPDETAFWRDYLGSGGLEWPEEYEQRLDPATPLTESHIVDRLGGMPSRTVSILDVGAGPLTTLGKTHPDKTIRITAVDPLADEYDRLLAEHDLRPPVRTLRCRGEDLLERFPEDSFDVAYARNSLDHSDDPLPSSATWSGW